MYKTFPQLRTFLLWSKLLSQILERLPLDPIGWEPGSLIRILTGFRRNEKIQTAGDQHHNGRNDKECCGIHQAPLLLIEMNNALHPHDADSHPQNHPRYD